MNVTQDKQEAAFFLFLLQELGGMKSKWLLQNWHKGVFIYILFREFLTRLLFQRSARFKEQLEQLTKAKSIRLLEHCRTA